MKTQVKSLALLGESGVTMSCGVGYRHTLDLALLWLWRRTEAIALIRPLAWELPYSASTALKRPKKKKKKKMTVFEKSGQHEKASIQAHKALGHFPCERFNYSLLFLIKLQLFSLTYKNDKNLIS